jgi:hypothetical protein
MRYYLLVILPLLLPVVALAQTSQVEFGKNRVQYHRDYDEWMQYESDNFITYWYGEGRNIGQAVVQFAELDFPYIRNILEHSINEKVQLIVYTDITDVKQSNIGNEEVFTLPGSNNRNIRGGGFVSGGQAKFQGNKAFVYFNGDHNDLRRQVREGIASVYLEHMLYGGSLTEVVQNAVMMNLPEWFKQGIIAYIGETWNTELDDRLRELLLSGRYDNFSDLALDYPRLAGQAFWNYVARQYGEATVSNLLYITRINRSVENGFLYVLSSPYEVVLMNWFDYYQRRYRKDLVGRNAPQGTPVAVKNRRNYPLTQFKISPNGQQAVYVINDLGKYKVYLQNLQTGERRKIFKSGNRNALQATDYNYPLLAWNPSGQEVAILYEFRDEIRLQRYDINLNRSVTEPFGTEYHRVYSLDYVNPGTLVVSATVRGFSDLFLYYPATRQSTRITNDFYDDLDAVTVRVRDRQGILFVSNRPDSNMAAATRMDTILPIGDFDLFYYDLENRPGELVQITRTPYANERQPIAIDTTWFGYLTNASGIDNQATGYLEDYIAYYEQLIRLKDGEEIRLHADSSLAKLDTTLIDTIEVYPVIKERGVVHTTTNLNDNIYRQHTAPRVGRQVQLYRTAEGTEVRLSALNPEAVSYPRPTNFWGDQGDNYDENLSLTAPARDAGPPNSDSLQYSPPLVRYDSLPAADPDNYLFQTEFADPTPPAPPAAKPDSAVAQAPPAEPRPPAATPAAQPADEPLTDVYRFRPGTIVPYRLEFRLDYIRTTADNNPLFEGLNSFASNPDGFNTQPLGLLLKGNVKDLFEDHVVEGGIRLPTTFNGTEYFLTYHNRKRRLDKFYALYRRNRRFEENFGIIVPARRETNIVLGQFGLRYPLDIFRSLRATATVRRDRTQLLATELPSLRNRPVQEQRVGLRLEYVFDNTLVVGTNMRNGTRYKVFVEAFKSFDITTEDGIQTDFTPGFMGVVAFDARHYQRLDRRSILALRLAGAANFAEQKILYYLGGADNSLIPRFNEDIPPPAGESFVFSTLANPMRGFDLNIRNGSNYLLGNAEVRVPIFQYLFRRIRSPFFRDFQLVGFFDIGTAWIGNDPFSTENPLNITTYPDQSNNPNSVVTVRVNRFRDPIVYGYGAGVRTTLFGYFLRLDYGWGVETGITNDPKLHLSMGMDF